jgi:periplasmic copper chaperone A
MAMRHVEALEIAPGKTEIFQPGGLHLMLFGLKAPIEAGQDVPLTLQFEDGTTREIIAKAKPLAEWKSQKAPMHDAHH